MHGNVSLHGRFSQLGSGVSNVSELLVKHGYVCNRDLYVTFMLCFFWDFKIDIDLLDAFGIVTFGTMQQHIIDYASSLCDVLISVS